MKKSLVQVGLSDDVRAPFLVRQIARKSLLLTNFTVFDEFILIFFVYVSANTSQAVRMFSRPPEKTSLGSAVYLRPEAREPLAKTALPTSDAAQGGWGVGGSLSLLGFKMG